MSAAVGRVVVLPYAVFLGLLLALGNQPAAGERPDIVWIPPDWPTTVGFWRFDEGAGGTAYDSSGKGHHGQIKNALWGAGRFGYALRFDGTDNSYVEVPDDAELTPRTHLIIEAWIRPEAYPTWHMAVLYKGDLAQTGCFGERSYSLWANSSGGLHFASTPKGENCQLVYNTPGGLIPLNQWSKVVVELNARIGKVFIDVNDVPVLERDYPLKPIKVGNSPLRIGGMFRSAGDQSHFKGWIDEVKLIDGGYMRGDLNCDGAINNFDIDPFVKLLAP